MTTSNSVLRSPALSDTSLVLGNRPIDPTMRAAVADARRAGYAEGHEAGRREAAREAASALERATGLLDSALAEHRDRLARSIADLSPGLVALAIDIARSVVGELPETASAGLADRIAAAIEQIDDTELVIRVSPGDASAISVLFEHRTDVTLVRDATLGNGDAIISGRWAEADLRLRTAWERVGEQLGA